jgi:hypothetical protein
MTRFTNAHSAVRVIFNLLPRRGRSTGFPATFWLAAVLFALPAGRLDAQTTPLKPADLKVTGVQSWPGGTSTIALGGGIEVTVEHLDDYLTQNPSVHPSDFLLYLESRPLPGLDVRRVSVAGDGKDKLLFDLRSFVSTDSVQSNEANWNKILGSPPLGLGYRKKVSVTTGLANQPLASTQVISLVVVPKAWGGVGIVVVLVVTIGLMALGYFSDVLRDPAPTPAPVPAPVPAPAGARPRQPYSLSRVQMAIWFWAIFTSYVFIWVMNGETASLNGQVLGILGISSATLAGSVLMDARTPAGGGNVGGPAAAIAARIPFLMDILSDQQGVSLPRFQAFAWTLVMVVIFLSTVWQTLVMPEFNGYLLSLMGLSSGTYVTMKANEH